MGDVVDFRRSMQPAMDMPQTFWDKFKSILRRLYTEETVHLVVAAIHDKDCYDRAKPEVRYIVDIYARYAP
jgi:hypothetical protein